MRGERELQLDKIKINCRETPAAQALATLVPNKMAAVNLSHDKVATLRDQSSAWYNHSMLYIYVVRPIIYKNISFKNSPVLKHELGEGGGRYYNAGTNGHYHVFWSNADYHYSHNCNTLSTKIFFSSRPANLPKFPGKFLSRPCCSCMPVLVLFSWIC